MRDFDQRPRRDDTDHGKQRVDQDVRKSGKKERTDHER